MKKPRISKPRLKWMWNKSRRAWEPYHRVRWTEDGKRRERSILLRWNGDPERLDALYWECEAGRHDKQTREPEYSWAKLVTAWRSDARVQKNLADGTKRSYRREMDLILEKNAGKDVRRTTRQAIRAKHQSMADTPRKADKFLQTVSLLWNYGAKKLDWPLGENPASGIDHYGKQREYDPWPEWMVEALQTAPPVVRTAAELILGTGQRPNAAITMRRSQFCGEWVEVEDEKGKEVFEIYCPADLRAYVETLPPSGEFMLAKNLRQPLGYDAVQKQFAAWRATLGDRARPYVLHGLRKLAIVRLAEAGCTDAEIQAVTNQSAEMVAYYRKKASRKRLTKAARERQTRT